VQAGGENYFLVGEEHNFKCLKPQAFQPSLKTLNRLKIPSESAAPGSPSCTAALPERGGQPEPADLAQVSTATEVELQGSNAGVSSFLRVIQLRSSGPRV